LVSVSKIFYTKRTPAFSHTCLWEQEYISEKSLTNIENGHNLPSLIASNYLVTALELDILELVAEIQPYIPSL